MAVHASIVLTALSLCVTRYFTIVAAAALAMITIVPTALMVADWQDLPVPLTSLTQTVMTSPKVCVQLISNVYSAAGPIQNSKLVWLVRGVDSGACSGVPCCVSAWSFSRSS